MLKRYPMLAEAGEADGGGGTLPDRGDVLPEDKQPEAKTDEKADEPKDKLSEEDAENGKKAGADGASGDEDEETAEEKAEREAEEAKAAKKANIRVPKARLDEVTAKARAREQALQKQIEELNKKLTGSEVKTEVDKVKAKIDEMQDQYEDLVQDGKKEEARAIRKKIEVMREELAEFKLTTASERARAAAIDDLKYDAALANVEAKFPALNPDHDDFDEEKSEEVVVLLQAFIAKGFTRAVALQKSVRYVMGPETEATTKGEDDKESAAALKKAKEAEARRRNAEADKKQPPNANKVGMNSDKAGGGDVKAIDVTRMSQAEFAKLDEKELAKLRGDVIDE